MIPIHELIHRMLWDRDFADARFVIGYYDRVADRIVRVPFREIDFDADDRFDFSIVDEDGVQHSIPLHRIRQVFRNGELIWQRRVE